MNKNRIIVATVTVALVLVAFYLIPIWIPTWARPQHPTFIFLRDVSLCASVCIYPSPELSATILVNATVPLSTLHLFINGTDEGVTTTESTMTHYALLFRAQLNNPAMPIVDGKNYTITFVAAFQDNSTCTLSVAVMASSGSGLTTTNT